MSTQEFLSTVEAGDLVRLSPHTLAKFRLYGGGPRFMKIGRKIVYRRSDIDAWLADRAHSSTSEYSKSAA